MAETTEQYKARIAQIKSSIVNEPYIKKMRDDIAEGISKTGNRQADIEDQFKDVIEGTTGKDVISAPEIIAARKGEASLNARLTKNEQETTTQFQQTMSQTEFDSWVATLLDGGPSIFMETKDALNVAYPNGSSGVALVRETNPAKIYAWNGEIWKEYGDYQGVEVKDNTITPEKTTFINKSPNVFNADKQTSATITDDSFMTSGVLTANNQYWLTAPIPLEPNTGYSAKDKIWGTLGSNLAIHFFSKENVYRSSTNTQIFTTPTLTAYALISVPKASYSLEWVKKNFMLVKGTTIPNYYREPGLFLDGSLKSDSFITEGDIPDPVKKLYVNIANNVLKVNAKYNTYNDIMYILAKKNINNLFDFNSAQLKSNVGPEVLKDFGAGTILWSNGTDFFSPHVVSAVNNADGDNQVLTHFTGGIHGYDNISGSTNNSATARTSNIIFKVEGRTVTTFEGHADYIEVIWTNYVQANNTKKSDGSGREVLKETISLKFDGYEWSVDYQMEALEAVTHKLFYGLQFYGAKAYLGGVFYHSSDNKKWNDNNMHASNAPDKKCSQITLKDTNNINYVDIAIDKTQGLGMRDYLVDSPISALTTDINKSYMRLLDHADLTAGDILTYKGKYRWFSKE